MGIYTKAMEKLVSEFEKMPGVGAKTAERLAFYILNLSKEDAGSLARAIVDVKDSIFYCKKCFNLSESETCLICQDAHRDKKTICVVEEPKDIISVEKTRQYKGLYHVLLGSLSPLDGIGPDDLKIKELLARVGQDKAEEIIIATNSDTEGEATALYLARILKPLGLNVTRIAYGIPVGGALEYADQATLSRAFEGRRQII